MGNCLNAGDQRLGCADAYDIITLLDKQVLNNLPKGDTGVSMLDFLKTELTDEGRQDFQEMAEQLSGWAMPKDDVDTADIGDLSNEAQAFARELVKLEKSLQDERKEAGKA